MYDGGPREQPVVRILPLESMNEFEHTLRNTLQKRQMSLDDLAQRTGYNPTLFKDITSGRNRQIPTDFFVRISSILELSNEEKDALIRSWAFGVEHWG